MKENILLSILVPIYNTQDYLENCVKSLLEQTMLNSLEFIFVDDCSTDDSVEILRRIIEKYPNRQNQVHILYHEENKGLAGARETALSNAKGDYVLTVDSDDWLASEACEIICDAIIAKGADIITFDYYVVYNKKKTLKKQEVGGSPIELLKNIFEDRAHGGTCLKAIKRDLYIEHGIHYIIGLNMLEDISVIYKLLYYAKTLDYIQKPLYYYYQGNALSYSSMLSERSKQNMLDLVDIMSDFYEGNISSDDLHDAFCVFKYKIKSLLLLSSKSYINFCSYKELYSEMPEFYIYKLGFISKMIIFIYKRSPLFAYLFKVIIDFIKKQRMKYLN